MPKSLLPSSISQLYNYVAGDEQERSKKQEGIRKAYRDLGLPEDWAREAAMGSMAGTTKFLKAGVPDRLGRMIGTETFKNTMEKMGLPKIGEEFAKRYPRIAAHISPSLLVDSPHLNGRADIYKAFEGGKNTIRVGLNPLDNPSIRDTMAHEGTHVAQRLGMGSKMPTAYEAATEIAGYKYNPFEQSARRSAERYSNRALAPFKTKQALESLVEMAEPGTAARRRLAASLR